MSSVIFAPGALRDLDRLHGFLRSKNPAAGKRAAKTIIQYIQVLEQHPQIGRPRDDMEPEYRELVVNLGQYGYVVLYRFAGEEVVIVAIRHQLEAGYEINKNMST